MPDHADILDQQDSLRGPMLGSLLFHGLVFSGLAFGAVFLNRPSEKFGDPNANDGAVGVTAVNSIPLRNRSNETNPLANESESTMRQEEVQQKPVEKHKTPESDPDAIALKMDKKKPSKREREESARSKFRPKAEDERPRLSTSVPQAASSPMYGGTTANGVGAGPNSSLGTRFGAYERLLRDRIAEKWRTTDVDARIHTSNPVVLTFDIQRDGSVSNIRVSQSSGFPPLDFSAQRAVTEASPLPPLPAAFDRSSAHVEFSFRLQR